MIRLLGGAHSQQPGRVPASPALASAASGLGLVALVVVYAVGAGVLDVLRLPGVFGLSSYAVLADLTPVRVTVTEAWQKVPVTVTAERLRTDATLWRRMHVDDWDKIGTPLREEALHDMIVRYPVVQAEPERWSEMTALAWDAVPQPLRAMAYQRMVRHWSAHYDVGAPYPVSPQDVTDTMVAILMVESWFEHRAVQTNPGGDRDLGLGQIAKRTRGRLSALYRRGLVDFVLSDAEYFNPWNATRALVIWFAHVLDEANGDLELAVRAYNRGTLAARRGAGAEYLRQVIDRRERLVRLHGAPPSWAYLTTVLANVPAPAAMGSLALGPDDPARVAPARPHLSGLSSVDNPQGSR